MSTRFLAIAALGLWLVTAAIGVYMFVNGQTSKGSDGRTAVLLNKEEKDLVLAEMRTMLGSVQGIVAGLSKEDLQKVRESAKISGKAISNEVPPALMAKLPLDFKERGMGVHTGFDGITAAVEQDEPKEMIMMRLGDQLNSCVACHATYRLEVGNEQAASR